MSQVKTTEIEGDVAIGRHVSIGGNSTTQGNSTVKKNLIVEGWLEAKNIKWPNKGMFATVNALNEAYPNPHTGWYALVGESLPAPIYIAINGEWVATGGCGGNPTIDNEEYTEIRIDALIEEKGQPNGIATLDADGKVPDSQLPPSVFDYVEFHGMGGIIIDNSRILDEMPEEHLNLPIGGSDNFIQLRGVYYFEDKGGFYDCYDVYHNHSSIQYYLKLPDNNKYGVIDAQTKAAIPFKEKLYATPSGNMLYSWNGISLVEYGHKPVQLGYYQGYAFPGIDGKKLENALTLLSEEIDMSLQYTDCLNLSNGQTCLDEPYSDVQEALNMLIGTKYLNGTGYFPTLGSRIRFLLDDGNGPKWVVYELTGGEYDYWDEMYENTSGDIEEINIAGCDAKYWEEVTQTSGNGSGDGGTCDCAKDVASLKQYIDIIGMPAAMLKKKVNDANTKVTQAANDIVDLDERLTTLEESNNSGGNGGSSAASDKVEFVNVYADGNGVVHGAHTSGLTYSQPTTSLNLRVIPTSSDELILLPTEISYEGKTIRILDPRVTGLTSASKSVKVQVGSANQIIIGAAKENNDYWLSFKGGYVELLGIKSFLANGEQTARLDWVLRTKATL